MVYEKRISRSSPGYIFLGLDDSGSQKESLPGTADPKWMWVERLSGCLLKELLARSTELAGNTPVIKPRYFLRVFVYGTSVREWTTGIMDIEAVLRKFSDAGNSFGLGGHEGGTDTAAAMQQCLECLKTDIVDPRFADSFPPMVFHLTDGESDTDPRPVAEQIRQLSTPDGNVLLVNTYIGTHTDLNYQGPADFTGYTNVTEVGANPDNITMFEMSSVMPDTIRQNLIDDGIFPNLRPNSRLFFDVRTKDQLKSAIQVVGSLGSRADRKIR